MIDVSLAVPVTTDPLLRWDSIAEHARAAHGARWASDEEAITAIIGAFDAILPDGCDYSPLTGVIEIREDQAVPGLRGWEDVQALNCVIAALAVTPPSCDLEALYGTETLMLRPAC